MAGTEIVCPQCGAKSRSTREIPAGARVKCPKCTHIFALGASAGDAAENSPPAPAAPPATPATVSEEQPPAAASESPRVEPTEHASPPASVERDDSKSTEESHVVRRDSNKVDDRLQSHRDDRDDVDRPRSRRGRDGDRDDDRPGKRRARRSKATRGNLPALIVVFFVVCTMILSVAGTVAAFAIWGGSPPPSIPTLASQRQVRSFGSSGWMEDDDSTPGLQSPSDEASDDRTPLSANLTSIFQGAPYGPERPRNLQGPLPVPQVAKPDAPKRTDGGMSAETLAKVKRATTYVVVTMGDGKRGSGSGFFVAKDLIATNAHVVGMLVPGSALPKSIQVVIQQGQQDEAACVGELVAVDPDNDLALVRVKPPNKSVQFPPPFKIVGATGLMELNKVFVIGYPLGESIGKAVTVSASEISSMRLDSSSGRLERVQVKGGMEHGNSGGPVVDEMGDVVGVSVAKAEEKSEINFAIPGERVIEYLEGRLLTLENAEIARESAALSLPITVRASDPLKKIQSAAVDWWWGEAGDKVPAGRQPSPDSKHQTTPLKLEKQGVYSASVPIGNEPAGGKVLWLQAHQRDSAGHDIYFQGLAVQVLPAAEEKPVHLVYRPRKEAPKVAVQTRLTERYGANGGVGSVDYAASSQMHEQRLGQDSSKDWFFRITFDSLDVRESHNGQSLDRVLSIDEHKKQYLKKCSIRTEVEPNGQIKDSRPAFKEVPEESRVALMKYTELVGRSLRIAAVTFPDEEIQPKHSWESAAELVFPSSDGRFNLPVQIKYTYLGLRTIDGRQIAELSLSGEVTEPDMNGGNGMFGGGGGGAGARVNVEKAPAKLGKVGGYMFVDVKTGMVSRMNFYAASTMTNDLHLQQQAGGREFDVKLAVDFELKLQRQ